MNVTNRSTQSPESVLSRLRTLLVRIDPDVGYDQWMRVLMVIFYETCNSAEGFELADDWSSMGYKYRGTNDVRSTWRCFKLNHPNPVRIGTLIRMASR